MAVQDISIPLKYVYVQSTAPTDKTEGKLWYNTSDKALYTSDGTNYVVLDFDSTYIDKQQLEQNINILINSASASSTLNDYDEMFLDIFTSAGGELSTVDTGNTTAFFSTNGYENTAEITQADNNVYSHAGSTYTTLKTWSSVNGTVPTFSLMGENSSSYYANFKVIFYYDDATNSEVIWNLTTFGGYKSNIFTNPNPTKIVSTIVIQMQTDGGTGNFKNQSFKKTLIPEDLIVQTNAETITANPTHHQLYCHNTVAGTGSITYDISFDGGTTWDTDQSLNTKNTSGHTGSSMIIKLNLNGTGSGNTAGANDYAVMLYY